VRLFAAYRARRDARAEYWRLDGRLGRLHRQLGDAAEPEVRADLLTDLWQVQAAQARVHDAAWGVDKLRKDAAGDMARSQHLSALLYGLLGDIESAVANPGRGRKWGELGGPASVPLDRMAATPDLGERMALLPDLYDAVVDQVGVQSAEVVRCLPYPSGRIVEV